MSGGFYRNPATHRKTSRAADPYRDKRRHARRLPDVPPPPVTEEDFAALPVLDIDAFERHYEARHGADPERGTDALPPAV